MREMVLNHVSATALEVAQPIMVDWIRDVVKGIAQLVDKRVVVSTLRLGRELHEIQCLPDYSLSEAIQLLREYGHRDEYLFFVRLFTKSPLVEEVREELIARFRSCEGLTLPGADGAPLVFCAIVDGVLIGFPSDVIWESDRLQIRFLELLDDEEIEEVADEIDHLSFSSHALAIGERHRSRLRAIADPTELWEKREEAFPNLLLGPDVENNLMRSGGLLGTIIGKLAALDQTAEEWRDGGGPIPEWRTLVSPESSEKMKNRQFRQARTFRSQSGTQEIFEWHARFGNSGRIHFRFDINEREIEVGYIGPKLVN